MDQNNGQKGFDFLDHLALRNLTSYETRVLFIILKWHLVYRNGGVAIAIRHIADLTKLDHGTTCRAVRGLLRKQILFKTQKNRLNFYSFTSAIQPSAIRPMSAIQPSAIQPQKLAAQPTTNINNSNEVKNTTAGSAEQIIQFTESYPGNWYKSVKAKAEKIFAGMNPENQQKALKALAAYKVSKSVKDGRIFSPVNFLKDPEIIEQYSKETPPAAPAPPISPDQIEQWRREQQADPFRGSLSNEFQKIVVDTAEKKSTTKGGS